MSYAVFLFLAHNLTTSDWRDLTGLHGARRDTVLGTIAPPASNAAEKACLSPLD
jgi:hypothetical protein